MGMGMGMRSCGLLEMLGIGAEEEYSLVRR